MKLNEMTFDDIEVNFFSNNQIPLEQKKEYVSLYILYRKLFTKYIMEKTNIKQMDEYLKASDLNFLPVEEKNMDAYQYIVSDEMDYFYIRNDIYLEKLSEDEIAFLKKIQNGEKMLDSLVEQFIEKTYSKVIYNDPLNNSKIYKVFYGPETMNYAALNNALVIGMRYDLFNNNLVGEEYTSNFTKQRVLLQKIFDKITEDFEKKLKVPCSVIEYNEYSIDLKKNITH